MNVKVLWARKDFLFERLLSHHVELFAPVVSKKDYDAVLDAGIRSEARVKDLEASIEAVRNAVAYFTPKPRDRRLPPERRVTKTVAVFNRIFEAWEFRDPKNAALSMRERRTGHDRRTVKRGA